MSHFFLPFLCTERFRKESGLGPSHQTTAQHAILPPHGQRFLRRARACSLARGCTLFRSEPQSEENFFIFTWSLQGHVNFPLTKNTLPETTKHVEPVPQNPVWQRGFALCGRGINRRAPTRRLWAREESHCRSLYPSWKGSAFCVLCLLFFNIDHFFFFFSAALKFTSFSVFYNISSSFLASSQTTCSHLWI